MWRKMFFLKKSKDRITKKCTAGLRSIYSLLLLHTYLAIDGVVLTSILKWRLLNVSKLGDTKRNTIRQLSSTYQFAHARSHLNLIQWHHSLDNANKSTALFSYGISGSNKIWRSFFFIPQTLRIRQTISLHRLETKKFRKTQISLLYKFSSVK